MRDGSIFVQGEAEVIAGSNGDDVFESQSFGSSLAVLGDGSFGGQRQAVVGARCDGDNVRQHRGELSVIIGTPRYRRVV